MDRKALAEQFAKHYLEGVDFFDVFDWIDSRADTDLPYNQLTELISQIQEDLHNISNIEFRK